MKRVLPIVLTVLLFATLAVLYHSLHKIAGLEDELADVRKSRKAPARRAPQSAAIPAVPDSTALPAKPAAEATEKKSDAGPDIFMGAGAKEIAARSTARLAFLQQRLRLRPDQAAALQKAAAAHDAALLAAFTRIRENKATPPDLGVIMDWTLGTDGLPVESLLDADQAAAFAEIAAAERTGRVEGTVNIELLEIQSLGTLNLTAEQKDAAFAALSGIVAAEDALGPAYYADDGQFMTRIDESLARRRDAMQSVLDATQLNSYRAMLDEDRGQIRDMFDNRAP